METRASKFLGEYKGQQEKHEADVAKADEHMANGQEAILLQIKRDIMNLANSMKMTPEKVMGMISKVPNPVKGHLLKST